MCGRWDHPKDTIDLLDKLEKLGFGDDAFWASIPSAKRAGERRSEITALIVRR
jgi:hypothetical protein